MDGSRTTGNNAPAFLSDSTGLSLPENSAAGTVIADSALVLTATDADTGDTLTYSMDGTDAASFDFDTSTREMKAKSGVTYNHEEKSTYSVTVNVDDGRGGTDTIEVTINIQDVNEKSATPDKPTLAKVTGSSTSLTATWTEPDRNGGPDIADYDVEYKVSTASSWEGFAHSGTATTTTITGLMASTSYQARVLARNDETPSDWSDASDAVSTNAATPGTTPTLSIADAEGNEAAGVVEFTVTLSATSTQAVTATWTASIGSGDTAVAADLGATTTDMVTVAAGDTTAKFTVPVADDATDEDDETFTVTLSGVSSNAQLGRATARGTINDDDDLPSLQMGDGGTDEDGVQAVVMAVTPASGREVMVTWTVSIESGNTTEPADFTDLSAATGTVTIPAGRTSYTFSLVGVVADDSLDENDETYTVTLSDPVNATLSASKAGTVTIKDDDPLPELSVEDVTAEEGGGLTFTVALDPVSGRTVEVDWATSVETDDNATSDMDFTAASSTLTFMPGDESMTFTVVTIEDTTEEPDETFTVTLSGATNATISATDETATGTITDDDAAVTTPTLSIADAEGNEAVGVAFTVTLSEAVADEVTATWTASIGSGDTAVAADLGATKTGTVTVAMANATTTTFTVPVANDATDEDDETFTVTLSNVVERDARTRPRGAGSRTTTRSRR